MKSWEISVKKQKDSLTTVDKIVKNFEDTGEKLLTDTERLSVERYYKCVGDVIQQLKQFDEALII